MSIIEKTVKGFINGVNQRHQKEPKKKKIMLFFQNQMSASYKSEEMQLQKIIKENVTPVQDDDDLRLLIYYRNRKLHDLIICNKPKSPQTATSDRHHVVYQYTCTRDGCNSSPKYIGYTSTTVWERFGMHTQSGSIKKHLQEIHQIDRIPRKDLIKDVTILRSCPSKRDLMFTEAILIKSEKPSLNSQAEGCDRLLKLFKH